jgi:nitroimidazol reductase NimA-like FMN-containing flavoprotein (pyridoxamine 5'-phosphate oxidase superfamily)
MWHVPDPSALFMLSVADTQKVRNLRRDPRVSVVAEEGGKTGIRGVTVQGRAAFLDDSPERRALVERFHARYAPHLEGFWGGRAMPASRVMFRIDPVAVHAWGFGR